MIISIFNQKGGVAKSTTSINLSSALAVKGKKVLVVDMDAQANSTCGFGIDDEELEKTIYTLLTSKNITKEMVYDVIQETDFNVDVLPSDLELSEAEITLSNLMSRETILKRILEQVNDDYDYIIIDCPPSLGLLSINSLVASDSLIIPVSASFFSIKGIKHLLNTVNLVRDNLKPNLDILGVLVTLYDQREKISKELRTDLINVFGNKVFNTTIRVNSQIKYSQEEQTPIIHFNKSCNGYIDYMKLANEVIDHERK